MIWINQKVLRRIAWFYFVVTSGAMANRWLTLFLGVALVQGLLSLSPIPVAEEEWEEFSIMMRDPAYRLPTTTAPRLYEVTLEPFFDNPPATNSAFTFDGSVVIYLSPTEGGVNEIVLHCNDLTINTLTVEYSSTEGIVTIVQPGQTYQCEMPYSFLRIPTTQELQVGIEYVARITFTGNLQTNMRGFYRSWYIDSSNTRRWMGTTQFQPGHAREAFPCYDEPGFKADFDFTIIRDADFSPTISNMPISNTVTLDSGKVSETFYRTPTTSTYLLAFIVSHYQVVAETTNQARPFQIFARDNIGSTGEWSLEVGEALLTAMEEYTQFPYYTMATNMNMKQAAIPDFSAGAMENWGLLTYREALILYDSQNSNHFYRQRVANIVSHEIAHMWFGNLVTCAWWDNLWLNEGFARFYQYYLTGSVRPELGFATRFITEQLQVSLLSDSVDTAHALTDLNVNDPTTVSAHFSTITYAKGAAILRMTQHLLGEETYVKALRSYLQNRQFNVAEPHHLFEALDAAAAEDGALDAYNGMTIDTYFRTWSEQAGHPLLTVTVSQNTGQITVTQARFQLNTGVSSIPSLYIIPITWTRGGDADFDDLKPSSFITAQVTVLQRGTSGLEWVIFNKQQTGFYRVNYDPVNWALITLALRSEERLTIHEYNRAHIVDDVFVLARSGVLSYDRSLNILSFLAYEDQYAPWMAAITGFNFLRRRLAHDTDSLQKLHDLIIESSVAVTNRLGFSELASDTYMDGLLRMYVNDFLCNIGHEQCIAAAISNFQNWRTSGTFIPANMRPWVYCTGLRHGTAEDFDFFWNQYLQEDLANEQVVMLQAAGCTTDQASLNRFLDEIVAPGEIVRPQDWTTAFNSAVTGNEENTMRMFEWLTNNVIQTTITLGSIATPLSYVSSRLLTEAQISEVESWLVQNQELIGTAYNTGMNGIATSRANLQWSSNRIGELAEYFETGYVDYDFEEEEDETTVDPVTTPPTTTIAPVTEDPDLDSASIAALSAITLVVTLAINFAI